MTKATYTENGTIEIGGRAIAFRRRAKGVIWFDFHELFEKPRSQVDYLEIASNYHTVLISGVRRMLPSQIDVVRRFTWLVDVFYDQRVKLALSAEVPAEELVARRARTRRGRRRWCSKEFARTASRLREMQSRDYFGRKHASADESAGDGRNDNEGDLPHRRTTTEFQARVADVDEAQLPEGDVTLRVEYSTINYKDALAHHEQVAHRAQVADGGRHRRARARWRRARHPDLQARRHAILNGWGVGETHWGGLAQKVRVKGDWLVKLPAAMTSREAMAIGTAGFTAMLCVDGARAIAASTEGSRRDPRDGCHGRRGQHRDRDPRAPRLSRRRLDRQGERGARTSSRWARPRSSIATRSSQPGKPLQKERWAGVVDSVGSHTLANACAQTMRRGRRRRRAGSRRAWIFR